MAIMRNSMRDRGAWIAVLVVVTLGAPSCGDDDPVSGPVPPSLNGQVLDADGAPVSGAHIGVTFRFAGTDAPSLIGSEIPPPDFRGALAQNAPNPFSSNTRMRFTKAEEGQTRLVVLSADRDTAQVIFDGIAVEGVNEVIFAPTTLPNGNYIGRLESDEGDSTVVFEIDMFLNNDSPSRLETAFRVVTDARGRFEILLEDLPVGEEVVLTNPDSPDPIAMETVLSSIQVCAWTGDGGSPRTGCADVDLGDLSKSVTVEIRF